MDGISVIQASEIETSGWLSIGFELEGLKHPPRKLLCLRRRLNVEVQIRLEPISLDVQASNMYNFQSCIAKSTVYAVHEASAAIIFHLTTIKV